MAFKNSRCVLRNLAVLAGMDCAATLGGKLYYFSSCYIYVFRL